MSLLDKLIDGLRVPGELIDTILDSVIHAFDSLLEKRLLD
jgi:hypothetical protein